MFRDGTLENFNKFTFGNVLVKTVAQIFGDIVNELLARLMNRHGVWIQSELFVYVRVVCAREPTSRCDHIVPRLTLCDRWRRRFFRRNFHRARQETASDCKHCTCEENQFCSHGPNYMVDAGKSEKNHISISRSS